MQHSTERTTRHSILFGWLLLTIFVGCSSVETIQVGQAEKSFTRKQTIVGYYAWWMKGAWTEIDMSSYDRLLFFTSTAASDGSLLERNGWPHAWSGLRNKTDSLSIPFIPTLAMMDADSIRTLFSSPEAIDRLIDTSLMLIEESEGEGLHLDIELFDTAVDSVRNGFLSFTDGLAVIASEKWPDARLSLFAPARDYGGLYDLKRIHPAYREIMVQGYDLHWQTGSTAGPVSALEGWDGNNWKSIVERFVEAGISENRLIMTVPYYGYEWPVESDNPGAKTRGVAKIITYAKIDSLTLPHIRVSALGRIEKYGFQRDPISGSPFYMYEDSTGYWQGWYEDEESLRQKYGFVRDQHLLGIAVFPLGYDDDKLDELIDEVFGKK